MKAFAKLTAIAGLVGLFAVTAMAQTPPAPASAMKAHAKTSAMKSHMAAPSSKSAAHVKAYTRTAKNGKVIQVKAHDRKAKTAASSKTATVKSYTRKGKNGKVITVKGYTRKTAAKTVAPAKK